MTTVLSILPLVVGTGGVFLPSASQLVNYGPTLTETHPSLECLTIAKAPEQVLDQSSGSETPLVPPMLLQREALEAGNPLATYAELLALEDRYRKSKALAGVYDEVRFNFEEFLGLPMAGVNAMSLPAYRSGPSTFTSFPVKFEPESALDVIEREAKKTRAVIWAEEHHLPQTRSLFEPLLCRLWNHGYRYLAAESFTDRVMEPSFHYPDYFSGYYLRDPVFSSAVRVAKQIGYKLIAYDTSERGPDTDNSFRDRTQAANIKARVFDIDLEAKVFVIAGRLHASEKSAPDGWIPMAAALKEATGINPFTVYAPTMSQRARRDEEHPWYIHATTKGKVKHPTIFVEKTTGQTLGFDACDAYVFWPRFNVKEGRADWMVKTLGRKPIAIPHSFRLGRGMRLVQAFFEEEPDSAIPVDQLLLKQPDSPGALMLTPGKYRLRAVNERTIVLGTTTILVSVDFDTLYSAVQAKHQIAFRDMKVDMKVWAPFVIKTLRDTDFSKLSPEQLLKLAELNLFTDLPMPDDDEHLKKVVSSVFARSLSGPHDALLRLVLAQNDPGLAGDRKLLSDLFEELTKPDSLRKLVAGPHSQTLLSAIVHSIPKSVLESRPDSVQRLAIALPRAWPAEWATIAEPLLKEVFVTVSMPKELRRRLHTAGLDSMRRFLQKNPKGNQADIVKLALGRLTGASARGELIGRVPTSLNVEFSTDPKIRKLSDLKGRVVVLDFWATWCGPCLAAVPKLASLQREFADCPVTILGVTSLQGFVAGLEQGQADTKGKPELEYALTQKAMQKHGITWPTVFTKEGVYNPDFGIEGIPFTAILDPNGKVRFTNLHPGNDSAKIRQHVLELLKEFKLRHP